MGVEELGELLGQLLKAGFENEDESFEANNVGSSEFLYFTYFLKLEL